MRYTVVLALLFGAGVAHASIAPAVPFVPNHGQLHERAAFKADTRFGALFVTHGGELVYALAGRDSPGRIVEKPVGGAPAVPVGEAPTGANITSLLGADPKKWRSDLPAYARVSLGEVWPGVALSVAAHARNAEKLFTLQPGARVEEIRMALEGVAGLRVAVDGSLQVDTAGQPLRFSAPVAFQNVDGRRRDVAVGYVLHDGHAYGFELGAYDRRHPVVIDPVLQTTFLGGTSSEGVFGMRLHPVNGEVYVFGSTTSIDFPATAGGVQSAYGGTFGTGFIARLNPDLAGGGLLQATYFGTDGNDDRLTSINAMAFHSSGDVFITGTTTSTFLPGTTAGAQPAALGSQDGFVARLSGDLTSLVQASYYGDATAQIADAIALSGDESRVYVAGQSGTGGLANLPNRAGAAQVTPGGGLGETFVAIFAPDLQSIERSSYHGGNQGNERVEELLVDPANGEVLIAVSSSSQDFPMPGNGAIPTKPNASFAMQATVARFSADLTSRSVATWFGGSDGTDGPHGMAIHPETGDVYLLGGTGSTDIAGAAGGFQPTHGGGTFDTYIARFSGDLTRLLGSTYFGGSGDQAQSDLTRHIVVHPVNGDLYIAGNTNSADLAGLAGANQETLAFPSTGDGVLARISADLGTLVQTTYFGDPSGATSEIATIVPNADASEIYIAGNTSATNLPALAGGAQTAAAGAFVSRMDFTLTQAGAGGSSGSLVTVEALAKGTATAPLAVSLLVCAWLAAGISRRRRHL